jgi:hypothetical protein
LALSASPLTAGRNDLDKMFEALVGSGPPSQADIAAQNARNAMAQQAQANLSPAIPNKRGRHPFANASGWAETEQETFPDFDARARALFMSRMGGVRGEFKLHSKDFLMCHLYDDKVFVFWLLGGKEGVVHEQVDIFPSDQLIAQFKMVIVS